MLIWTELEDRYSFSIVKKKISGEFFECSLIRIISFWWDVVLKRDPDSAYTYFVKVY